MYAICVNWKIYLYVQCTHKHYNWTGYIHAHRLERRRKNWRSDIALIAFVPNRDLYTLLSAFVVVVFVLRSVFFTFFSHILFWRIEFIKSKSLCNKKIHNVRHLTASMQQFIAIKSCRWMLEWLHCFLRLNNIKRCWFTRNKYTEFKINPTAF